MSKPVSTLTVPTVHRQGMDGGEQEKKKVHSPTILPLFPRVSLRKLVSTTKNAVYLKVKNKRDHYTFLGNCPPTPPLSQH